MNRTRLIGATVALALIVVTSGVNAGVEWTRHSSRLNDAQPGPWPSSQENPQTASGPVAAPAFFAKHVARMKARHPGVKLEILGYQYLSSGTVVTGEQVKVAGPGIFQPCFYLAIIAENENGPAEMVSASCRGNG